MLVRFLYNLLEPIITRPVAPIIAEIGRTVTLRCNAENYLSVNWFRGTRNNPDSNGLDFRRTREIKSTLIIEDVRLSDNGTYTCELTSISVVDQKIEVIVRVSDGRSLKNTTNSSVSPSTESTLGRHPAATLNSPLSNGRAAETMLDHIHNTDCPTAATDANDLSSWILPAVIVSSLFGSIGLIAAIYCLIRYRPRRSKKSYSLNAENPTYTLTAVVGSRQRARAQGNGPLFHIYETMSATSSGETGQGVDSTGYSVMHNPSRHQAETLTSSPTSITELLPQSNSNYVAMNTYTQHNAKESGEREVPTEIELEFENQEKNGKGEEQGTGDERRKPAYVNMDDPELE